MLGQLLDRRYRIVQTLGAGSFGKTYIALDIKLFNAMCVVKQLRPFTSNPKTLKVARRLFDSEAQLLHRLGIHDQIPQLLAHFQENRQFYLVQQFIKGRPLTDELTPNKQLSEDYVIDLLQAILQPLAFVHENNVIHRDIKPSNLIRRESDGKIVLIDFGAIKQMRTGVGNAYEKTSMTVIVGTRGYMPSEQASGSPRLSSDIYAVGMIGIQALTGLKPEKLKKDQNTAEIIWRNLVQISPRLADILDKMTRYDFRQRYRSATEALHAVQQLTSSEQMPSTDSDYITQHQIKQQQLPDPTLQAQVALDRSLVNFISVDEQQKLEPLTPVLPPQVVAQKNGVNNGHFLRPFIPVDEQQGEAETLIPQIVVEEQRPESDSLLPQKNSILLLGIGFGTITSLVVMALIYIFFNPVIWALKQPPKLPSQNAVPSTNTPRPKSFKQSSMSNHQDI
ncbi:MAG: serine/threonine protein kinase [Stigonema ocellatum SAG 48.90 = DSM 106950]|nr:serine/threonine protein kinase [Stigonema ocellatum SAG 48.90 = DSM 106950]